MKKNKIFKLQIILFAILLSFASLTITGCDNESLKVNNNLKEQAENFNLFRRVVVVNTETDKILFEVDGFIDVTITSNKLYITIECGKNRYKKHIIGINNHITYVVEDLEGAKVDKYHYEIHYHQEGDIVPFTIKGVD